MPAYETAQRMLALRQSLRQVDILGQERIDAQPQANRGRRMVDCLGRSPDEKFFLHPIYKLAYCQHWNLLRTGRMMGLGSLGDRLRVGRRGD